MVRYATALLFATSLFASESVSQQPSGKPAMKLPEDSEMNKQQPSQRIAELHLSSEESAALNSAMAQHQYQAAERLLIDRITPQPGTSDAAARLRFLGGVYLLAQDPLHAAVAWNKADAIAPLPPDLRFSLAMAYVEMHRPDWARKVLNQLAAASPASPRYPYWLGRLDYDAHEYEQAIGHFSEAIRLDPAMARAYDNRGLCRFFLNQNEAAIADYRKSIELDRTSPHPSPWPPLNLGIALSFIGDSAGAEAAFREAIRLDANFARAHYELGNLLVTGSRFAEATTQFELAASADPTYAEPHAALARMYRRAGDKARSDAEVARYKQIHDSAPAPNTEPARP